MIRIELRNDKKKMTPLDLFLLKSNKEIGLTFKKIVKEKFI